MALYQPTNITPSTFAGIGGGVVDVNDRISLSFQVNGNSEMTGWTVTVYTNNAASTQVAQFSIGRDGTPISFFGTDERGNVNMYEYTAPTSTWSAWNLTNGNSYKMKLTLYWTENGVEKNVSTQSDSVFITRAKPTLSISPASGTLTAVSQDFTSAFSQAQGDAVSWVRWVLSGADGDVIEDTGTLYTGLLAYSYNGFFSGKTYTLSCTVETSSGVTKTVTNTYAVSYTVPEQTGELSANCNPDDSVTLSWAAGQDIPGVSSAENYGSILNGVLHLAASRSITWNEVNGESMAFVSPYCFAWRGQIADTVTSDPYNISSGTWTPDGSQTTPGSTVESHTVSQNQWTKNPNVSNKETRAEWFSITADTTVNTSTTRTVSGAMNTIDAENSRVTYTQRITFPYYVSNFTMTSSQNILGWEFSYISGSTYDITVYSDTGSFGRTGSVTLSVTMFYYTGTEQRTVSYANISNPVVTDKDSGVISASAVVSAANKLTITVSGKDSQVYQVQVTYNYTTTPSNLYMARFEGVLNVAGATLTAIAITSAGGTSAYGTVNQNLDGTYEKNHYVVTVYNSTNSSSVTCSYRLSYTTQTTNAYKSVVTGSYSDLDPYATFIPSSVTVVSTTAHRASASIDAEGNYTVTMTNPTATLCSATLEFQTVRYLTINNAATLTDGENDLTIQSGSLFGLSIILNSDILANFSHPAGAWSVIASASTNGNAKAIYFDRNGAYLQTLTSSFDGTLPSPVSSVEIDGEQLCDFIYFSRNEDYFNGNRVTPIWNDDTLLFADFIYDLQGGTLGNASALAAAIYRNDGDTLDYIGMFADTVTSIRDYGIRSGKSYTYDLYYVTSGEYSAGAESSPICRQFRQHTLIEAEEDPTLSNVYHPVHVWRFGDNLDAGAYSNQNSPVLLQNFTKYPLWQPSSQASRSGTLVALLGKLENGEYFGDNAKAMDALFALSESVNPLFYRDMKGNLYMVRLAGPITQTINNRTGVLEVSVSVPWVEVGDAADAKIYAEG